MSAVVHPRCGHASHLMEVDSLVGSPQIHLHFLTENWEEKMLGYAKLEVCCHGCGESILVYYSDEEFGQRHMNVKNEFVALHENCPDHGYETYCPNWRSKMDVVDLRNPNLTKTPSTVPYIHPEAVPKTTRRAPRRPRHR